MLAGKRAIPEKQQQYRDLINRLLTIAGEMMEDASVAAIIDGGTLDPLVRAETVKAVAEDVEILASAVSIIVARAN